MNWHWLTFWAADWWGRGAAASAFTLGRVGWWLLRRRKGAALPFFGFIGRHLALEWTNITLLIENRTLRAKNSKLEEGIRQAGLDHLLDSPASVASSSGSPERTRTTSSSDDAAPSPSTST